MDFSEVVKNRYSCKKFSGKKVEKEKLDRILAAGQAAPTAKNLQEQHIYVTPCRYNAPTVLVVAFDKNSVFTYPGGKRDSGIECSCVVK